LGGDGTVLYSSWLFQRVVPPVASFSLGSLGFLTPFDYSNFRHTLAESFDKGVTARLRMRFECTIMRAIEHSSSEEEESTSEDMLEMRRPPKKMAPDAAGVNAVKDGGVFGVGGKVDLKWADHHTEEYWRIRGDGSKSKEDWVREEEGLNRGHRASESFAVLNELVVVCPPSKNPLPRSCFFLFPLPCYG
jgi:ATP-NAD kinase N-terminal domain